MYKHFGKILMKYKSFNPNHCSVNSTFVKTNLNYQSNNLRTFDSYNINPVIYDLRMNQSRITFARS